MFKQQQIIAPREVYREIKKGNDELKNWADDYIENFLEPVQEEADYLQEIMKLYPQHVVAKMSTRPWADPFIIACAALPFTNHPT